MSINDTNDTDKLNPIYKILSFLLLDRVIQEYQKNIEFHSPTTKVDTTFGDMESHLLKSGKSSLLKYNFQYLTAASLMDGGQSILAWFNNQFLHTAPLALNLVHNAVIRALYNPDYGIDVKNAPLNFLRVSNNSTQTDPEISFFGYTLSMTMVVVLSIVSSSYVMFYVRVSEFVEVIQNPFEKYAFCCTGKRMPCEIHAVCERREFGHILDFINFMGCTNEWNHSDWDHHSDGLEPTRVLE